MEGHTAGPWYASRTAGNHQGLVIAEATGVTVAITYDRKDARLIAAAPDLLAALELCWQATGEAYAGDVRKEKLLEANCAARAAITLAEGGSNEMAAL